MLARRTALLATLAAPALARAQAFPTRPLRIIVPAVAGGGSDISTRVLIPRMAAELGQPLIAENRPGGSGNLANELLAQGIHSAKAAAAEIRGWAAFAATGRG